MSSRRRIPSKIRAFAAAIARRFDPACIVLFGSHAYGAPIRDSDVDLLVVMPTRNPISQAVKIRWELPAPFALDLIVRTSEQLQRRLAEGDAFVSEIMTRGIILHEKG